MQNLLQSQTKSSKFLEISCPRCKNAQIIFGKSTLKIKCDNCNKLLIKTQGGKAKIKAKIIKIL